MRFFQEAVLILAWAMVCHVPTYGAVIAVEPDGFSDGADLTTVVPGVSLSAVDSSLNPVSAVVVSRYSPEGFASTGSMVFGRSDEYGPPGKNVDRIWTDMGIRLRADFALATDLVSIDFIADDDFDPAILEGFDSTGSLVASSTVSLPTTSHGVQTVTITSLTPSISYVLAYGTGGEDSALDNLTFNEIPEPSPLLLLALGGLALLRRGERR